MPLLESWLEKHERDGTPENVTCLREREGGRDRVFQSLVEVAKDHFVAAGLLDRIGYPLAATVLRAKVPTRIATQSGDLGEILATEYVRERTDYQVPINRLRYKDDREMAMRGDDVIGVRKVDGRVQALKIEAKSRAQLSGAVVKEACASLQRNRSRPSASSVAFVSLRLREEGRDAEAELVEQLLGEQFTDWDVEHLVFTLSGNDPTGVLSEHAKALRRRLAGIRVVDHQKFIRKVYEAIHAAVP
ncbi:MAG TPA: Hachiman antiphage defense system protein HamA [Longimicrobium sp.]